MQDGFARHEIARAGFGGDAVLQHVSLAGRNESRDRGRLAARAGKPRQRSIELRQLRQRGIRDDEHRAGASVGPLLRCGVLEHRTRRRVVQRVVLEEIPALRALQRREAEIEQRTLRNDREQRAGCLRQRGSEPAESACRRARATPGLLAARMGIVDSPRVTIVLGRCSLRASPRTATSRE